MIKGLRSFLLNVFLKLIFVKNVYVYSKNKTKVIVYLIIPFKDRLILLEKEKQYEIARIEVDISQKQTVLESIRELISSQIFKDLSVIKGIELIDSYRDVVGEQTGKRIQEGLFFRVDVTEDLSEDCLIGCSKALDLEKLKIECFKNKFNLYDYRLLIRASLSHKSF